MEDDLWTKRALLQLVHGGVPHIHLNVQQLRRELGRHVVHEILRARRTQTEEASVLEHPRRTRAGEWPQALVKTRAATPRFPTCTGWLLGRPGSGHTL